MDRLVRIFSARTLAVVGAATGLWVYSAAVDLDREKAVAEALRFAEVLCENTAPREWVESLKTGRYVWDEDKDYDTGLPGSSPTLIVMPGPLAAHFVFMRETGELYGFYVLDSQEFRVLGTDVELSETEVIARADNYLRSLGYESITYQHLIRGMGTKNVEVLSTPLVGRYRSTSNASLSMTPDGRLHRLGLTRRLDYRLADHQTVSLDMCVDSMLDAWRRSPGLVNAFEEKPPVLMLGIPAAGEGIPTEMDHEERSLQRAFVAIPFYRFQFTDGVVHRVIDVDARNGRTMVVWDSSTLSGASSAKSARGPLPSRITASLGKHRGLLVRTNRKGKVEESKRVAFSSGGKILDALYDPEARLVWLPQEKLWLRPDGNLAAKLSEASKKPSKPFGSK